MLSDLHVLSGIFSGFYTDAETHYIVIDFISRIIHCMHMRMSQLNCVIVTSAAFLVVRIMPVEMYGKSWFACFYLQVYIIHRL